MDCCRPEENVEAVEVSAYDLKDHPDFKFRPAQTVIRVTEIQVGNHTLQKSNSDQLRQ